jgi:HEAT repeat protein
MKERLIAYHMERLKNKQPAVRLDAINELRLLDDPSALPALEYVFRHDMDAEVRKAAQAAGRELFTKHQTNAAQPH